MDDLPTPRAWPLLPLPPPPPSPPLLTLLLPPSLAPPPSLVCWLGLCPCSTLESVGAGSCPWTGVDLARVDEWIVSRLANGEGADYLGAKRHLVSWTWLTEYM